MPKVWPGATVVCIASGPSLTPDDAAYCRGRARVIAVCDGYRLAPWADLLYACDAKWWRWHQGVPAFTGPKYALEGRARGLYPDLQVLRLTGVSGLERDPGGLRTGRNSGYQAINLAVHLGASRILLLGYDMKMGPKGEAHFFGSHPPGAPASPYASFVREFAGLVDPLKEAGVTVVNCSRESALTCFPRQTITEALPASARIAA